MKAASTVMIMALALLPLGCAHYDLVVVRGGPLPPSRALPSGAPESYYLLKIKHKEKWWCPPNDPNCIPCQCPPYCPRMCDGPPPVRYLAGVHARSVDELRTRYGVEHVVFFDACTVPPDKVPSDKVPSDKPPAVESGSGSP
jgi:hypothetical protein